MTAEYNDRIIAFLDLQGFSEKVRAIKDDEDFVNILTILEAFKKSEALRKPDLFLSGLKEEFSDEEKLEMARGFRASAVSDCIIISYPKSSANLYALIIELILIQWFVLFKYNYLMRGFVTIGKCYHDNGILFGEGYIKAYVGCEQNELHKMPCIALDEGIFEVLSEKHHSVLSPYKAEANYSYPYLNYALALIKYKDQNVHENPGGFYQVQEALKFINKGIQENNEREEIVKKYQWTLNYLKHVLKLDLKVGL